MSAFAEYNNVFVLISYEIKTQFKLVISLEAENVLRPHALSR